LPRAASGDGMTYSLGTRVRCWTRRMIWLQMAIWPFQLAHPGDCLALSGEPDRQKCFENFYRQAIAREGNGSKLGERQTADAKTGSAAAPVTTYATTKTERLPRRKAPRPQASTELVDDGSKPWDGKESPDQIVGRLAEQSMIETLGRVGLSQAEAEKRVQANRLINGCATEYCRAYLEPYQATVDRLPAGSARREAERELQWQFRVHANPASPR
jgi:hypothetical protein